MKTHHVIGMDLPIIAELGEGWFLVAHPNRPTIANEHTMATLDLAVGDPPKDRDSLFADDDEFTEIPHDVRRSAVEKYIDYTWDRVKADFAS